jgi:hypothetical protein
MQLDGLGMLGQILGFHVYAVISIYLSQRLAGSSHIQGWAVDTIHR